MRAFAVVSLVLFLIGVAVLLVGDRAPAPGGDAPPAALCVMAPPAWEHLATAMSAPSPPTPTPGLQPTGPVASAEIAADVRALVRTLVGCVNAGDPLRSYALYTDSYLARVFARQGALTVAQVADLATPRPDDGDAPTRIVEIGSPEIIGEGRVGFTLVLAYASVPMPTRFWVEAVQTGDGWAIDDLRGEISFSVP